MCDSRRGLYRSTPPSLRVAALFGLVVLPLVGCTSWLESRADRRGLEIQREKSDTVDQFRASDLVDPRGSAAPRELVAPPVDVPKVLDLEAATRIATRFNRGYLSQREGLFLAALALGVTRRDFLQPVFGGDIAYAAADGSSVEYSDATTLSLSARQLLPTGGTLTVSGSGSLTQIGGGDQSSSLTGTVSVSQPLLRGAWRDIAFEPLTASERNLLYDAREFEEFRQRFAIDIIEQYYALLSQRQQLENTRKNIDSQRFAEEQAKALYRLGRGTQLDVFRAEQSLLSAQTALLDAEQALALALDRFKIDLGLPTDVDFELSDEEFPQPIEMDLDLQTAIRAALHNRLDLRTTRDRVADAERAVRIAKNAILPDLDLTASYTAGSAAERTFRDVFVDSERTAVGLTLEIPLDRLRERNALRAALINLEQSQRSLREAEDRVILEVRDALRQLERQTEQVAIERRNIESFQRSLEKARLENRAGLATNREIVEAQDSLTQAENSLLDRIVAYEVTRLNLLRQLGVLFVDPEGRVIR
ncbi:MAG: TolC family protein [Planctomycetota bacterium]